MGTQPPSPKRGQSPPQFSAHVYYGQTAGCIKMPLGMMVGLGPGRIVLHGDPAPPPKSGTATPNFRPMSFVAKRSTISATAEHLFVIVSTTDRLSVCSWRSGGGFGRINEVTVRRARLVPGRVTIFFRGGANHLGWYATSPRPT